MVADLLADGLLVLLTALWVMLPAYVANSSAVLTGGRGVIDGGRTLADGRRVLGDGKTWSGLLGGALLGTAAGLLLQAVRGAFVGAGVPVPDLGAGPALVVLPLATALGALLGDITASFVKRRLGKERGSRWWGVDQLDFVAGALLLAGAASWVLESPWFAATVTLPVLVAIVVVTPFLHVGFNVAGYKLGKKEVPW